MNTKNLDFKTRQKILYLDNPINIDLLIEWGNNFLENDSLYDALEFYNRANYQEGILKIKDIAIEEGNYFLYSSVSKILKRNSTNELNTLANNAEKNKRFEDALKVYTTTKNQTKIDEIKNSLSTT
jgi:hypothetical protein